MMWHGNTWHGSVAKQTTGLRAIKERVTAEILEANSEAFAQVVGVNVPYGYGAEGPDYSKIADWPGKSQLD